MKFEILDIISFGTGVEASVKIQPNLFQRFFGKKDCTKKYYSQFGITWYEIPNFEELPATNPISIKLSQGFLEQINIFNKNLAMGSYQQAIGNQTNAVKLLD